jgi:hypothetical protein
VRHRAEVQACSFLEWHPVLCHFAEPMSHAHTPPQLPDVTDEAGETPSWVPVLGVVLFALMVAYGFWAHQPQDAEPAPVPAAATP